MQNQPWCDVFTDEAFVECFGLELGAAMTYQPIGGGSARCRDSAQFFKGAKAFFRAPEPGDVIFFFVGGEINHQGIVIRVVGGSVITVEGNSSDMVAERCYSLGDASIAGYGRPDWQLAAGSDKPGNSDCDRIGDTTEKPGNKLEAQCFYELRLPYLSRGSIGEAVRAAQQLLIGRGFGCGPEGADGDFGPNTESAVRTFQESLGLSADGVIGPDTGAALYGTAPSKKNE